MTALEQALNEKGSPEKAAFLSYFFKTGKGQYGEGDVFIGVTMPEIRALVKQHAVMSFDQIIGLLHSPVHEHRMAALVWLVERFKKSKKQPDEQHYIYELYLFNLDYINNWDLVDVTCRDIIGGYLFDKDRSVLDELAARPHLWAQRVAMVSTWHFISKRQFSDTIRIAELLLGHKHDLIHKAVGWMLREVGKKDELVLIEFLDTYATQMPRTALRYAIERLPESQRKYYLGL
ncbi:MAG: DNA alkylation repair protein [Spirosomaceae bacterium]|jgi:3-methyladenine DNA glycosylase AlkD|nr:DNA alkylation repair protein [Spirosomataceae bacterium]